MNGSATILISALVPFPFPKKSYFHFLVFGNKTQLGVKFRHSTLCSDWATSGKRTTLIVGKRETDKISINPSI